MGIFFILLEFLAHKFKRIGIFSQFALFAIFRVRLFDWFSNTFRALPYPKKVFQYSPSFTLLDSWPRLILSLSRSSIGFSLVRWIWFSIGDFFNSSLPKLACTHSICCWKYKKDFHLIHKKAFFLDATFSLLFFACMRSFFKSNGKLKGKLLTLLKRFFPGHVTGT